MEKSEKPKKNAEFSQATQENKTELRNEKKENKQADVKDVSINNSKGYENSLTENFLNKETKEEKPEASNSNKTDFSTSEESLKHVSAHSTENSAENNEKTSTNISATPSDTSAEKTERRPTEVTKPIPHKQDAALIFLNKLLIENHCFESVSELSKRITQEMISNVEASRSAFTIRSKPNEDNNPKPMTQSQFNFWLFLRSYLLYPVPSNPPQPNAGLLPAVHTPPTWIPPRYRKFIKRDSTENTASTSNEPKTKKAKQTLKNVKANGAKKSNDQQENESTSSGESSTMGNTIKKK